MEISLKQVQDFQFSADNGSDQISIGASPELSPGSTAFRPMQLLLASLASCMSIDILSILKKQRQLVDDFQVSIKGQRADTIPAVFTSIHLAFFVKGDIDKVKLERAIALSYETYCSVTNMLKNKVSITTSFTLNNHE